MIRHPLIASLIVTLMTACGTGTLNSDGSSPANAPAPHPAASPEEASSPEAPATNEPATNDAPDETPPPSDQSANTTPNDLPPLDAMHIGDEFSIKLRSNSGTGYSWQLAPGTLNDRIVEFVTETYQAPEGNLIGASGTEEFVFKAVRDGTTTLTLHYVRPWETDVEPADVHETEITVLP